MPPPKTIRARELRREMSGTERRVWYRLRRNNLGFKFRRQHPIGPFFADFVSLEARLVVEIDGILHDDPERDRRRTAYIESRGFRVMHVWASETDQHLDDVIESIWSKLREP